MLEQVSILQKVMEFRQYNSLIQILIDDHADTYYPFLSIILQDVKSNNEYSNNRYNTINGSFLMKIVTYNYLAGVWEPFLEKTPLNFEITNDMTDPNIIVKNINMNISQYKNRIGMNVNISDLTVY